MDKTILIFSGYNQRAIVAFLRTLEVNNVRYGIIAASTDDNIFLTDYSHKVYATRKKKQLNIEDLSDCIYEAKDNLGADRCLIAPSTEALNRFLIDNRQIFESINCELPLVGKDLYETVSDKESFGALCRDYGIQVPNEYTSIGEINIPFVAKPKKYFSVTKEVCSPVLVFSESEKNDFVTNYNEKDFYFQEFVDGPSYYLLYYFYKNGEVVKLSQQNYIQQPEGKSMIAAVASDIHNELESTQYEQLFKSLNFYGLVMIEMKKRKGRFYMVEANPRFWGPSQLFVDDGINLFEDLLFEHGFINKKPVHGEKKENTRYFWGGGIATTKASGSEVVFHNYSEKEFNDELVVWRSADVYNRQDTKRLYDSEMKG